MGLTDQRPTKRPLSNPMKRHTEADQERQRYAAIPEQHQEVRATGDAHGDGQINEVARNHDKGHADGHHADERLCLDDPHEVLGRCEVRHEQPPRKDHQPQQRSGAQAQDPFEAFATKEGGRDL